MAERIRWLYGQLVILDVDLAALLGVTPERLNALVKKRWMPIKKEIAITIGINDLRHLEPGLEDRGPADATTTWLVYTEHGVLVAGAAINSPEAVQQSILLTRAFVAKRESAEAKRGPEPRQQLH